MLPRTDGEIDRQKKVPKKFVRPHSRLIIVHGLPFLWHFFSPCSDMSTSVKVTSDVGRLEYMTVQGLRFFFLLACY